MLTALATTASTGVAITSDQLQPLVDGVTANLNVLLPVGITLMSIMIGVTLIPRIVYKFL